MKPRLASGLAGVKGSISGGLKRGATLRAGGGTDTLGAVVNRIFMKKSFLITASLLSSLGLNALAGDLTGTITFKGTAPAEINFADAMQAAPDCVALYADGKLPTTHFYAVSASGGLADVVVTIKGTPPATGTPPAPVVLDQKGCVYSPSLLVVQTGQTVIVRNSDPCVHNVHTVPKENTMQNMVQAPGAADLQFVFDKPEPFLKFQCDVHPWMFAWVTVVDGPYFALSDKDGKFTIKNVPPGKYTVEFAHRKLGVQTAEVEVKDGGATQDMTFEAK
jgi:plastocyanin